MSGGWERGSTRGWRRFREQILERDGQRCRMGDSTHPVGRTEERSEGCEWAEGFRPEDRGPLHVHHTRGRMVTGDDPRYCVASCGPCNLAAGDPTERDPRHTEVTAW